MHFANSACYRKIVYYAWTIKGEKVKSRHVSPSRGWKFCPETESRVTITRVKVTWKTRFHFLSHAAYNSVQSTFSPAITEHRYYCFHSPKSCRYQRTNRLPVLKCFAIFGVIVYIIIYYLPIYLGMVPTYFLFERKKSSVILFLGESRI